MELANPVTRGGQDVTFTVLGAEAPLLKTLKNAAQETILADLKLTPVADSDKFTFVLPKAKASPGLYKLQLLDGKKSKVLHATLTTEVEVASAVVQGKALKQGEKLKSVPQLVSASGDTFSVEVSLKAKGSKTPLLAHQAFLRFTQGAVDTTFVLLASANKKTLSVAVNIGAESKKFSYLSGVHAVQLILGDTTFENAIVWDLGSVDLTLGAAPIEPLSPLYAKPLLHESDVTLTALPEIEHVMRAQDSRPSLAVSNLFTLIVVSPLGGFLLFLLGFGAKLSKFPSGVQAIFALGFIASMGSILGLFVVYWLQLTMFATLGYLAILTVVALFFGHQALGHLASQQADHTTKSKKE
ncbi:hypothetical protein SPRG_19225 [Saprolegnia parasitica CBS 223.65]|uniref:Ribophorin II n=1 Tax=Saprolegnia parasitica (strain CBS 223.65) TaxID=695850 RepID=A0A067CSU8_SAPPC|nr:hypothetical protein SPRG_19225 [Saprolegnia parasitica CBS 223.65]KDO33593.1 hypothetical protein SPRG_19225 [Saprolegnia parasitica CBS 223.65]|eukprot:XP_012195645.1 hypothetical protein SPRG_19225 [Saprolegnia parasitica CBS 223.65]